MDGTLRPIGLYLLAVALLFAGLYLERSQRWALLPLIWAILIFSLKDTAQLPSHLGLNVQVGMTNVITFLYSPVLFSSFAHRLNPTAPWWDLPAAYRLYNNPRGLALRPSHISKASFAKRLGFSALRTLQSFLILAIRALRDRALAPFLATLTMGDFRPSKEWIVPRLLGGQLTSHDLAIRAHVSLSWIFDTYAQLTLLHALLSIVFVGILQTDEPEEWPSLFSSPLEAFTVRRFWGSFWHRLVTPSAAAWARCIASFFPFLRGNSTLRKAFIASFVFSASGLAHVLVGWRLGDEALERDLYFFWANFGVVALEIVIARAVPVAIRNTFPTKRHSLLAHPMVSLCAKGLGFFWVSTWFIIAIPHVLYPKIHATISAQLLAATFGKQ